MSAGLLQRAAAPCQLKAVRQEKICPSTDAKLPLYLERAAPLQAATSQLDAARQEAACASAAASRHQDLVARLTADNLVFLMRVSKCEQELGVAARERDELKVALEQQQGPWFDEVRCNQGRCDQQPLSCMEHAR